MTELPNELSGALAGLAAARDRLAAAKGDHLAARDRVHGVLERLAAEARGGMSTDIIPALYWHAPEVHVEQIGRACGVDRNRVYQFAGESVDLGFHCPRCSQDFTMTLKSRTAVAKVMGARFPDRLCDPCHEEWLAEVRAWNDRMFAKREDGS